MKIAIVDSGWNYTLDTPYIQALGGTQSAIAYFAEEMKIRNHEVYLFNKISENTIIKGVHHISANTYLQYISQNNLNFDIMIVSCLVHDLFQIKNTINNPNTLYCLWTGHDIDQNPSKILKDTKAKDMVDLFIFVSEWQRNRYIETYNINYNKTMIMRNGIGKPFEKYLNLPSNKILNSMSYCSIPWRGLDLLEPIYKKIITKHTDSSLKIFSGMNIYNMPENNDSIHDKFKILPNVICSYGINQEQLAAELYKIDFLTYPNTFQETSCITVLQAMSCGCMVVTSDLGALKETMNGMNTYVDINLKNVIINEYTDTFVNKLDSLMSLPDNIKEILRERNREHIRNNYTWDIICRKFEKDITNILLEFTNYNMNYKKILTEATIDYCDQKWNESYNKYKELKWFPIVDNFYSIKLNMGVCMFNLKNLNQSKILFKICKKIKEDYNIYKNLAAIELEQNNINKFIKYAKSALSYNFDQFLAILAANKLDSTNQYHESIGLYENIISIDPSNVIALNNLGNNNLLMISKLDNIDNLIDKTYRKSLQIAISTNDQRKKELIISNIIFNNLYNWNLSESEIYNRSKEYPLVITKNPELMEITNRLSRTIDISNRKIRIGYISTDFITHPVGFMFDSILKNHNTEQFEIFCYDNSAKASKDQTAIKLRSYNNAIWYDINEGSDTNVLIQMVKNDLDILVDMMGHTSNNRMAILQYKPARIIISYFAYPSTCGFKEIDYKITDIYATPPETQQYFTEKLYYMPNGFQCYTPPTELDATKNYTRNEKYTINLACFNNPKKLSIPTIETFAKILNKLPEAKLFLRYGFYKSSYLKESIISQFIKYGATREQIDIGNMELVEALSFYNMMDIVLDPFPYNGGTISSEALYMNTPIITLAGTNYVSRVGISLLHALGMDKYVANTHEEYITKVVTLARNQSELRELHSTIRNKMKETDLLNSKSFTKHLENAYKDMIGKYSIII